jgi:hypothetical protein
MNGSGGSHKSRVYMEVVFRQVWDCQFVDQGSKVALPRCALLKDEKSLLEVIERGGVHVNPPTMHKRRIHLLFPSFVFWLSGHIARSLPKRQETHRSHTVRTAQHRLNRPSDK